jgi:hypothetical protein
MHAANKIAIPPFYKGFINYIIKKVQGDQVMNTIYIKIIDLEK